MYLFIYLYIYIYVLSIHTCDRIHMHTHMHTYTHLWTSCFTGMLIDRLCLGCEAPHAGINCTKQYVYDSPGMPSTPPSRP